MNNIKGMFKDKEFFYSLFLSEFNRVLPGP